MVPCGTVVVNIKNHYIIISIPICQNTCIHNLSCYHILSNLDMTVMASLIGRLNPHYDLRYHRSMCNTLKTPIFLSFLNDVVFFSTIKRITAIPLRVSLPPGLPKIVCIDIQRNSLLVLDESFGIRIQMSGLPDCIRVMSEKKIEKNDIQPP